MTWRQGFRKGTERVSSPNWPGSTPTHAPRAPAGTGDAVDPSSALEHWAPGAYDSAVGLAARVVADWCQLHAMRTSAECCISRPPISTQTLTLRAGPGSAFVPAARWGCTGSWPRAPFQSKALRVGDGGLVGGSWFRRTSTMSVPPCRCLETVAGLPLLVHNLLSGPESLPIGLVC